MVNISKLTTKGINRSNIPINKALAGIWQDNLVELEIGDKSYNIRVDKHYKGKCLCWIISDRNKIPIITEEVRLNN